ncbi:MAG: hypothetical protein AAF578_10680 [Pseudomonadota bacterium]
MKIRAIMLSAALGLFGQSAWAACTYPTKIDIPNGATATQEEMIEGQKAVKQYMADMNTFLDCIEAESKATMAEDEASEAKAEREAILSKRHNAAVDEMETVAANFNDAVRAYKARQE